MGRCVVREFSSRTDAQAFADGVAHVNDSAIKSVNVIRQDTYWCVEIEDEDQDDDEEES